MASTLKIREQILRQLEKENGHIDPADVVAAARDPHHPLHDDFNWVDKDAAHEYRLHQARLLIRSCRLNFTVDEHPIRVPAYVKDFRHDGTGGYAAIMEVRKDEDVARATVVDAMQRVINAVRRAKTLALILGIEDELASIDKLAGGVVVRVSRVEDQPQGEA
jgi:hypothetical protein